MLNAHKDWDIDFGCTKETYDALVADKKIPPQIGELLRKDICSDLIKIAMSLVEKRPIPTANAPKKIFTEQKGFGCTYAIDVTYLFWAIDNPAKKFNAIDKGLLCQSVDPFDNQQHFLLIKVTNISLKVY